MIRFIWSQLEVWERACLIIILLIIFGLGVKLGSYIEARNWQAKAGRAAYFLALRIHEQYRTSNR